MKIKCLLSFAFYILFLQQSIGQNAFPFFKESNQFPKDLLKSRTVVFMNVANLKWEKEAAVFHQQIRPVGIDAVAYYALSDILSGHDATNAFYRDISNRSISNMMIIHENKDHSFSAYIGEIAQNGDFFEADMPVYVVNADNLKDLGAGIVTKAEQAKLERENFLIIDVPETFKRTNVIKTRRVVAYNPDLRIDKLAIPKFEKSVMVTENIDSLNAELDSLMKNNYPFKYGLVDPNLSDDELISQGYLMVLRRLENNIESLKRMLGYDLKEGETIHISVRKGEDQTLKKLFASDMGHKYYVQQLYTKDIYLGDEWDADKSWQEALKNHLANLKASLKR